MRLLGKSRQKLSKNYLTFLHCHLYIVHEFKHFLLCIAFALQTTIRSCLSTYFTALMMVPVFPTLTITNLSRNIKQVWQSLIMFTLSIYEKLKNIASLNQLKLATLDGTGGLLIYIFTCAILPLA